MNANAVNPASFDEMRPVLVMAGGTGGHVFPALAVANALRARGIVVVWVGTKSGLEAEIVPAAGIPIEWISVSGLRGKTLGRIFSAPIMLAIAAWQSARVILKHKPRVVLGMGGFVTGPCGLMARLLGKPLCIHEQNAIAGLTNRLLAKLANAVMEAFPHSLPASGKVTLTGNPVREDIASLPEPAARFCQRRGPLQILVLGGSLGAQALNEVVPAALSKLKLEQRPKIWHQTGQKNYQTAHQSYQEYDVLEEVQLVPFIDDMQVAYAWADLVICRAGALTIAELTAAGVGAILVPYPYAVDDHQTVNGQYMVDAGAARIIQQRDLFVQDVVDVFNEFRDQRAQLLAMAEAARALAKPNATEDVARICMRVAGSSLPERNGLSAVDDKRE